MEVRMKKFLGLAALGLGALFVALPEPAAARSAGIGGIGRIGGIGGIGGIGSWGLRGFGVGWRGYGLSGWYGSPRFFHRDWSAGYYYPVDGAPYHDPYPAYYPNGGASYHDSYGAYYPQDQAADVKAVTIRMHVPSDARVWFEGEATSQSGTDRTFVSPPLAPGREYVYHLRVQWYENGKAVERNRKVRVHAGDRINLTFDR
jgi:uncharacterized protein (TIGR03000 family)